MTISNLLTVCSQLEPNIGGDDLHLDYEIGRLGVVWDEEKELVKKIYKLLEEYRNS